ncbi:hypothetical protein [Pontibacter ruber]|uniref:Auto-transporter adhesin head GIN domain-containing protein n=1 Tax=Pontibacter ruber TaxID=1343895 RepID=A0ABW5CU85_9BACT|nr:hypothetical protein [Pontibacter ruber]
MKAFLLITFPFLISFTAFSQEMKCMCLEYSTAIRPDNAYVKVSISSDTDSTYSLKVEAVSIRLKIEPESLKIKAPAKSTDKEITITKG